MTTLNYTRLAVTFIKHINLIRRIERLETKWVGQMFYNGF